MLVPGFQVQELPVRLSNINNLRFAPDGRLFALGYDGRIHILIDTDHDGLEDRDELFWDKPGLSVPVGMALAPEGVYVSSHGKVSLLRDSSNGVTEQILTSDWPPTDVIAGGVDATGVTLDAKGDLFFGLITADYSNPYRVKDGVSHYDLAGKRGTIQKLGWDRKTLTTVATGIRVPYALAFNKAGDLFCTDQEGETWCPNGNPLDELNHILPGRNYGFPPRHEKWLPNLISESPVVAFGPQHQSTCGLVFNEPKNGQGLFGPKWWQGDALIAGESRGKIWRVRLVKSGHGYVGKEFIIARLSMLTTDVAISPHGALYVSCHSGEPDWGTGPKGEGKIFKITYTDPKAPQPVLAWAVDAAEVRVAFDKPIAPSVIEGLAGQRIEFGEYVSAADRFENLKPPYKVVKQQEAMPRGRLNIVAARLYDPQTLVLATDPHPQAAKYALSIPGIKAPSASGPGVTIDVEYNLGESLTPADKLLLVSGLPHGRAIAGALKKQSWSIAHASAPYPFIHAPASEEDKSLDLAGADFERGRALFNGEQLKCATCHRLRGEGAIIGPDLSNLASRDAASVLRDIKEPSASINPDYVAYNVRLENGEDLIEFVRAQDERTLRLVGADGKEMIIPRTRVKELRPSSVSLMPAGLLEGLNEIQVRDLLVFLLNSPPLRSRQELGSALATSHSLPQSTNEALEIVLVASKQDHGPAQHDYTAWQTNWHELLATAPKVSVSDAWLWPSAEQFQRAHVIVFYYWNRDWTTEKFQQLDEFQARGGGIVALHSATIGNPEPQQLANRIGLASHSSQTKYLHTPVDLKIVAPTNHPITGGLPSQIHFLDEPYWPLIGDTNHVQFLGTVDLDGSSWPMMWTFQKGKARVFANIFGHYTWTWKDPFFRLMLLRGIGWAAVGDASRLETLVGNTGEMR
jgi:putative heme-binding domain-containing protein